MTEIRESEDFAAYSWTKENVIKLADELKSLRKNRKLQFKNLVTDCLLPKDASEKDVTHAQQRYSRWVNHAAEDNRWMLLREDEFRLILAYIYGRPSITNALQRAELMPDGMFQGMIGWLGSESFSLRDIRSNFPGVYTVYRHSLLQPGHVAVGRLTIEYIQATGAVRTREEYKIDKNEDMDETNFEMTGYFFRKNNKYRIFSKHVGTTEIQNMYINAVIPRGGTNNGTNIVKMSGIVTDIQGHTYYSTRFACIRKPIDKLHVIPLNDVPKSILSDITAKPKIDDGYVVTF